MDDLATFLLNPSQFQERALQGHPDFFAKLANSDRQEILFASGFPLGNRPMAIILPREKGSARMGQEHLDGPSGFSIKKNPRANSRPPGFGHGRICCSSGILANDNCGKNRSITVWTLLGAPLTPRFRGWWHYGKRLTSSCIQG